MQTESDSQWPRDLDFSDASLGGLGSAGPTGGFGASTFNPDWLLAFNMPGPPTDHSPEINFGASQTPPLNQGLNPLVTPHTATQQPQWNNGNHFPPGGPSLSNFSPPNLFDTAGFSNPGPVQQNQFLGANGNSQSNGPLSGAHMVGGR
jgi:hypothetical protein